ncbi:MAG: outer membrane protein assembly factor BamA [Rhizobiales bacterium]|nr:outer membrane protein assembly factor BamA [Hyphomicrobiales bacterium]
MNVARFRLFTGIFYVLLMVLTVSAGFAVIDGSVSHAQAQAVSNVAVSGNERISRDTILTYVTISPGQRATAISIDESLKALFATGLFKDVSISTSGSTLNVRVVENPVVNGIAFIGNKKLKEEDLAGAISTKARGVFNPDQIDADVARIKQAYQATGRLNVAVKSTVEPLDKNRVNVVFRIDEAKKTGIAQINFIGNNAFSDGRLRNAIATRETGLLSFLSSSDIYDEARLAADEEQLRRFYFNHGYADFEVISSAIDIDAKSNKFFINITVNEGERYRYGKIDIDTVLLDVDQSDLRPLVKTKEGDVYDAREVERSIEALSLAAAAKGFAFAEVRPRGEQVEGRRINVTYAIDQGSRVFVERINIFGNTRTREYVIRREFDIAEGDAFNQALLTRAERRIRNLGIFANVKVTRSRGSAPDRVVVNVQVDEQPTGDVAFGVGADLGGGFLTNIAVTERNFLGRGQFVRAAVGVGSGNQTYDLSFTEPYFLGRRISAGFDLFRRDSDSQDRRSFDVSNTGGALRIGLPLTEKFQVGFNYTYDFERISEIETRAPASIRLAEPETTTSSVGYTLVYNTLDSNQDPKSGLHVRFNQDFAGVGGDVNFVRSEIRASYYRELNANREITGLLRGRAGNIIGIGEDVRILDNFFAGGDLVRGFDNRGLGPRLSPTGVANDDSLGGTNFFAVTAEVIFPPPLVPRSVGIKTAIFAEAGSLFGFDTQLAGTDTLEPGSDNLQIRSSVGAGIIWNSPFGPLRGDFAYVLSDQSFDERQFFRIGGGTRF